MATEDADHRHVIGEGGPGRRAGHRCPHLLNMLHIYRSGISLHDLWKTAEKAPEARQPRPERPLGHRQIRSLDELIGEACDPGRSAALN